MMLPLLRAPPFAGAPCISWTVGRWEAMAAGVSGGFGARDNSVAAAIIAGRVGGSFWMPSALRDADFPVAGGELSAVILPEDAVAGYRFCRRVLEGVEARRLVAVLPHRRGGLGRLAQRLSGWGCMVTQAGDPHSLVDIAGSIYVTQMGDEAVLGLLAGRRVLLCDAQGMKTQEAGQALRWLQRGTRYSDPFSRAAADCTEIIELLTDWRRMLRRNRQVAVCAGMAFWKQRRLSQIFGHGGEPVLFRRSVRGIIAAAKKRQGAVAVWARRVPAGLEEQAAQAGVRLLRVEDGFIRSQGLGSDFLPPCSIVADGRAHYFDPAQPSELEHLLATTVFSGKLQARARRLIDMLVSAGVSKYASGGAAPALTAKTRQRVLLVIGQVADDLSLQLGGGGLSNFDLLRRVRTENPDAFIVYRPHPDVDAGHRPGAIPERVMLALADMLCRGPIAPLISAVDEVHTITSLAGFEALLRGRVVKTYGQPFYAGWGLTVDQAPLARRQRRLSIEELAAAVLILYPYYADPLSGLPCGPEVLVSRLQEPALWRPSLLTQCRRLQGRLRRRLGDLVQP